MTILAVTGVTADIDTPNEEASEASQIEETSFQACWEAIAEAASYRLDVATDIDFQHILDAYNNKVIDDGVCAEVANLLAEHEYYWRVRSVDGTGGQSASSAPRRVRTAGGTAPATDEESTEIEDVIGDLLNTAVSSITIHRTLYKDGYFNTLCLPFNLSASRIATSPLAGCELYEFDWADQIGDAQLDVHIKPADAIVAGVPYLIRWPNTGEVLSNLVFTDVTILTDHGQRVGTGVEYIGIIGREQLEYESHFYLFVGEENQLYWPIADGTSMRGFRAYFAIPTGNNLVSVRRGMPARLVLQPEQQVPTAIGNMQADKVHCTKIIENGQLFILHNGMRYNALGQIIK